MKIKIRLFARYRELIGSPETNLEVQSGITSGTFKNQIENFFPQLKNHAPNLLIAINGEFVDSNLTLKEGDEVAILPPLSGG